MNTNPGTPGLGDPLHNDDYAEQRDWAVYQLQQLVIDDGPGTDASFDFLSNAATAFDRRAELSKVTASDIRRGFDMQGYRWVDQERQRAQYMLYRRYVYPQLQGLSHSTAEVRQRAKAPLSGCEFYRFRHSDLGDRLKSQINHFQLRDLVWATSSYDVYFWHADGAQRWNPWLREIECVMERRRMPQSFDVSAFCADAGMAFAGNYRGKLCATSLWAQDKRVAEVKLAAGIINHVSPNSFHGNVLVAHNSGYLYGVDAHTMLPSVLRRLEWAVNSCAQAPNGSSLQCVVGDSTSGLLLDSRAPASAAPAGVLEGHYDYSFSCAFSPDGRFVATGCQDMAARVYDVRYARGPLVALCGNLGAMRSVRFSPCGRFLMGAEPADYVHLWDTQGFEHAQEIALMGEISGAAFSPDSGCLFVGVSDALHSSGLIEFNAKRPA
ncbi:hypothetical protein GGI07_002887 [Coemansia sp. Benny D115]|nr:hypothetical protein GGI07_002887 [Coemansia sp. Benny D115]